MITWCLEGSTPNKKGLPLCFLTSHMMTLKLLPPPLYSSMPHKYDNCDKAPCTVFSYLQSSQNKPLCQATDLPSGPN